MRLIDADRLTEAVEEIDWYHLNNRGEMVHGANSDYHQPWCKYNDIHDAIRKASTVEPTLYGYKIEHLALIARVMEEDGITPEEAVQIFKSVQTIALKVIDEINKIIERSFEQVTETRGSEDDTAD